MSTPSLDALRQAPWQVDRIDPQTSQWMPRRTFPDFETAKFFAMDHGRAQVRGECLQVSLRQWDHVRICVCLETPEGRLWSIVAWLAAPSIEAGQAA